MVKAAHEDYGQAQDIARGRESRERGRESYMAVSSVFFAVECESGRVRVRKMG